MNYKIENKQLKNLIQKLINQTLDEMVKPCERALKNNFQDIPDWLNIHDCIDFEELDGIVVNDVKKHDNIESSDYHYLLGDKKYPVFITNIDILFTTSFAPDWSSILNSIKQRILYMYKIIIQFEINEEINQNIE